MRVIVVGAGIVGASIAMHLAIRGVQVTIVDAIQPATQATAQGFAWVNANFAESDDYFALRHDAVAAHRALREAFPVPPILNAYSSLPGCLWWEEASDDFDAVFAEQRRRGYPTSVIDAPAFSTLEPALAEPPTRAIHAPEECALDAPALVREMLKIAISQGAVILTGCTVDGVLETRGRIRGVMTSQGELVADRVVMAAGAATQGLLEMVDVRLPMDNKRGLIVTTEPVEPLISHIIMAPDVHFRQAGDGRLIAGEIFSGNGPNADQIDVDPIGLAQDIVQRIAARIPEAGALKLASASVGTRPVPLDRFPAIGPVSSLSGLYTAVMHSGVTLGPLIGEIVACEIIEDRPDQRLASFRPTRFN